MHIPDGFIDAPVSAGAAVLAAGAVALSLRGARRELTETSVPMAGLTAVFIFAAQMVNFPVGAGTSGHLIGAALAVILVGPHLAVLAMTMVLVVQALAFADGGLSALGLNVLNLAVIAPLVAWAVFVGLRRWLFPAAIAAGFLSTLAAAAAFAGEFALGGTEALSPTSVTAAMLGVHTVIGLAEGVITGLIVVSIAKIRPDVVYGLQWRRESTYLVTPESASSAAAAPAAVSSAVTDGASGGPTANDSAENASPSDRCARDGGR